MEMPRVKKEPVKNSGDWIIGLVEVLGWNTNCSELVVLDILVPIYTTHVPFNISPECYLFLYVTWPDWTKTIN